MHWSKPSGNPAIEREYFTAVGLGTALYDFINDARQADLHQATSCGKQCATRSTNRAP